MNARTWIILAVVAVVLTAGAALYAVVAPGTKVEVAKAERGAIRALIDERGMTRLPQTYVITMPYSARIEPITLEEGDAVAAEDKERPVARIVPADLVLAVDEARAAVERLDEEIEENLSNVLEKLAWEQAEQFNQSMAATVKAAENRLTAGDKRHEVAQKHLQRVEGLVEAKTLTEESLDQAELREVEARVDFRQDELVLSATRALHAATSLLPTMVQQYITDKGLRDAVLRKARAEAQARLEKALLDQKRGTITSPVDGVVLQRFISNERFLAAGEPLVEIGRLEDLEVEADVLSLDVVEAKPGDSVEIYGPAIGKDVRGEDRDYARGTVARIYPAGFTKISSLGVEQQRVKVVVALDAEDLAWLRKHRNLGVGYRVRVRIATEEKADALVVPRSALFRSAGGRWQLYAVRDGRLAIQAVDVGVLNDRHAEIVEGLEDGDLVVRAPESDLEPGTRVRAETAGGP